MRKTMGMLLGLLAGLLLFPATAMAYTEGYFYYEVEDQSVIITGYFGDETEVTVPASIAGNPVNVIAEGAFEDTEVTELKLPDTIMKIEEGALGDVAKITYNANLLPEEGEDQEDNAGNGQGSEGSKDKNPGGAKDSTGSSNAETGDAELSDSETDGKDSGYTPKDPVKLEATKTEDDLTTERPAEEPEYVEGVEEAVTDLSGAGGLLSGKLNLVLAEEDGVLFWILAGVILVAGLGLCIWGIIVGAKYAKKRRRGKRY